MDVSHPDRLWLLIPWSLLAARAAWGRRRRDRHWGALGQDGKPAGDGAIGGMVAAMALIVALAGPRWGIDPATTLPPGRDVVLLIDASRSMGAEDAVPDRLGVAIESADGLLDAIGREPGDRVAVVAFAGAGVVRCGLTEDLAAARDVVRSLRPGSVRPGGTDLGAALETAAGAFDDRDHADGRMIVVFTDGEDLAGAWRDRVEGLTRAGIVVNAVAIGDPDAAHPVPAGDGPLVLSYRGKPVLSRRSDTPLDALAAATGGLVVRLGLATADLGPLYRDRIAPAARRVRLSTRPPDRASRHGLFLLAALVALPIGARPSRRRRAIGTWAKAATLVALIGIGIGAGGVGDSASDRVGRGRAAFEARRFVEALDAFETAIRLAPDAAVPRFDAAAALFALGRYPEAADRYREARDRGGPSLKAKADFGLGNVALMVGDPRSAIDHYDACLASPDRSPTLDPVRRDADANRAYARLRLDSGPPPDPESSPTPDRGSKDDASPSPPTKTDPGPGDEAPGPRGQGGAGGSSPDTRPVPDAGSPEQRLDAAVDRVRQALRDRPADAPAPRSGGDIKDW